MKLVCSKFLPIVKERDAAALLAREDLTEGRLGQYHVNGRHCRQHRQLDHVRQLEEGRADDHGQNPENDKKLKLKKSH